ncbi:flavodoxin family protein [Candidatus Stoquefichus massiliensis]|uniref:flavodoxin family protein n=1 Tax=Candidatus Stoquefichus massiliensis TaxID=1470350 RepID=UPI000486961B|nr:NAD(P)H-dependent oxidoreductase [Candidatus Stoquefichus massiliensis]
MTNIFILVCSNRKLGTNEVFSKYVLDILNEKFQNEKQKVNIVYKYISDYDINVCLGCQRCFTTGMCILKDDQTVFIDDIKWADVIVFSVPVYINNIPGNFKVLLDRIAYLNHRMPFLGKSGILLTTSSNSGIEMVEGYMEMIYSYLGISLDLKLSCLDKKIELKENDCENISNYIKLFLKNKLEIPDMLKNVFNYYHKHFSRYKFQHVDDSEVQYWKNEYLMYDSINEVLYFKRKNKKEDKYERRN